MRKKRTAKVIAKISSETNIPPPNKKANPNAAQPAPDDQVAPVIAKTKIKRINKTKNSFNI